MGHLEIGLGQSLHIREERLSADAEPCRVLYISDVHLRRRRSKHFIRQVTESVLRGSPDLILLGGDMLDQATELKHLKVLVAKLVSVAPVLAIGGNHDRAVGILNVQRAVEDSGGEWIERKTVHHIHSGRTISVSGPSSKVQPSGDFRIQCAHNPRVWKTSRRAGFDVVLAGHLHGCQIVAFKYRDRLFPGAFFYPYNFLHHKDGDSHLIVSRGVSDLIPIRWRCPREVVLCLV